LEREEDTVNGGSIASGLVGGAIMSVSVILAVRVFLVLGFVLPWQYSNWSTLGPLAVVVLASFLASVLAAYWLPAGRRQGPIMGNSVVAGLYGGVVMSVAVNLAASMVQGVIAPLWKHSDPYLLVELGVFLLANLSAGVLAAVWLPTPRTVALGARAGALAGLAAGATNAALTVFLLQYGLRPTLPPPTGLLGDLGAGIIDFFCAGVVAWVPLAATLGALGGALMAALERR
jgi:hypothetical protein